ncbi:MAG: type I DNA topoisomerase [Bradymonadia bacterium]
MESPAKAKTIGKYLGDGFHVEASVGHVRDLPETARDIPESVKKEKWARTGVNVEKDFDPLYVLTTRGRETIKKLKPLVKQAPEIYLATDEDREGEAIAWHLFEVLKPKVPVKRMVFHEITPRAIKAAMAAPRTLDMQLVRAQETRRIIDRLFGYNVSPVLWRKVRPKLSAGRVQSVAVRLIVARERARLKFVAASWWDLDAKFTTDKGPYQGTLTELGGQRLAQGRDFDPDTGKLKSSGDNAPLILDEATATAIAKALEGVTGAVSEVTRTPFKERPSPPFTTSTLQQEANRKLRWSARRTMNAAQRLYENGWITYMRTDSTHLSPEAINLARNTITSRYGAQFLPPSPRYYKTSAKGAQEAHEAIRPAGDTIKDPSACARDLGDDEARLYSLIVKRTLACQMADATGVRMTLDTEVPTPTHGAARFRATGKSYTFQGFRRAYIEGNDDGAEGGEVDSKGASNERLLPDLNEGDASTVSSSDAKGHTTQPPSRLTDASLVKELESRGIGRPSTYASIIETIERRKYVFKRGTALIPTWTAFAVTNLLEQHFDHLVNYQFTAQLESGLDNIAEGERDPVAYMRAFYEGAGGEAADHSRVGLVALIDKAQEEADPRAICSIPIGNVEGVDIVARVGRYGPFIEHNGVTVSLPDDLAPDELTMGKAQELIQAAAEGPRVLGQDPATGLNVTVQIGRFGHYVQLGETEEGKKTKPKRESLLKGMDPATIDLETALKLLSLPRELGNDKEGNPIHALNGRYGAYIKAGKESRSLPDGVTPLDVTLEQALELLAKPSGRRAAAAVLAELGQDPEGAAIVVKSGRYGPYVTDGTVNATLPKGTDPAALSLADALALIEKKRASAPAKKGRRKTAAKKPAAKKAPAKKPAAKKTTAKKTTVKKPAAKKTAAKKPAAKKPAAKKAPAKKPAAPDDAS